MQNRHHHFKWLYLLAALVLSLQSFAIWHDTAHPFHTADAQCERLEIIKHMPVVNANPSLLVSGTPVLVQIIAVADHHLTVKNRHLPQLIRGPPVFS